MTYVISDLHGYRFEEFTSLLRDAGVGDEDTLYILGDVIDRGDDGARYLEWLLTAENTVFILGNHEHMMLKCDFLCGEVAENTVDGLDQEQFEALRLWLHNGANPTITGLLKLEEDKPGITRRIFDYMSNAPLYAEVRVGERDFVLVHGGLGSFSPKKPLSKYTASELVWTRPSIGERYFTDRTTVIGHTPTLFFGRKYTGRMLTTDTWIDIDAGAAAGLPPLLLRLDDMAEFRPPDAEKAISSFVI